MGKARESGMPAADYWESFFDAEGILDAMRLGAEAGDVIEFGCGYGTFTEPAARRTEGAVFALDIDPAMTDVTQQRIARARLTNVDVTCRDFVTGGAGRPSRSAAYAMLFNILHLEDPVGLLKEAHRTLRPGGIAGIIHWKFDPTTPRGPSMEIRPRPAQCRDWAIKAGFHLLEDIELPRSPHHYGIVARRCD